MGAESLTEVGFRIATCAFSVFKMDTYYLYSTLGQSLYGSHIWMFNPHMISSQFVLKTFIFKTKTFSPKNSWNHTLIKRFCPNVNVTVVADHHANWLIGTKNGFVLFSIVISLCDWIKSLGNGLFHISGGINAHITRVWVGSISIAKLNLET